MPTGAAHERGRRLPRHEMAESRPKKAVIAVVVLLFLLPSLLAGYLLSMDEGPPDVAAAGPGYWVSTRGDDSASGDPDHPWRTVAHAVAAVPAGSKIFLRRGTYQPFTVDKKGLTISGAPGEPATIRGEPGVRDVVLVTANSVTLASLTVTGCVPKKNPDINVTGDHGSGVRVDGTTGVTIRGVRVRDSHGKNAAGLPVGCYGILATSARNLSVRDCEVDRNGAGIVISHGGKGVVVERNLVHDQDVIIQNTAAAMDDFGGYGLAATFTTDATGPVFRNNTVVHNIGPSTDYGVDGGGMEIYDAAHTTITGNTFIDNNGALETGTGSSGSCSGNVFSDNTVASRGHLTERDHFTGMVLRCAAGMVIKDNTFEGLSDFTFLVSTDGPYAGTVDGLAITGNTVTQPSDSVVYRLQYTPPNAAPPIVADDNKFRIGQPGFAIIGPDTDSLRIDDENTVTFQEWQSKTGLDEDSSTS